MKTTLAVCLLAVFSVSSHGQDIKETGVYRRLKAVLDAVPAIDTHDHPMPFDALRAPDQTENGPGMTLHALWQNSYYAWFNPVTPWPKNGRFEDWWSKAKDDFAN